jgi:hypothetical protein
MEKRVQKEHQNIVTQPRVSTARCELPKKIKKVAKKNWQQPISMFFDTEDKTSCFADLFYRFFWEEIRDLPKTSIGREDRFAP